MKIYVGHSKDINYEEELYKPIREFETKTNHTFILPHEKSSNSSNSRSFYDELDLFIAEVSMPATGLGIELGWAYDSNIPIVCISKKGKKVSGSLKVITNKFYEYETTEELKNLLDLIIKDNF
jgi:hypothetical protein